MQDQTAVFYKLKLKRTRSPMDVIEKMHKCVKKKGATKNWTCTVDSEAQSMSIDFGDGMSETFCISFNEKKVCDDCCKVCFPLSGELFDDEKKSGFKALLNMIYSVRTSFSEMKITDDYGVSESFFDAKENKIALRELAEDEANRAKRLVADGRTSLKDFITALMFDCRGLPYSEDFIPYINRRIGQCPIMFWRSNSSIEEFFRSFVDSFLFETTEYQDKGRLYMVKDYYGDLNGVFFSVLSFIGGLETLTGYHIYEKGLDPKSLQVLRLLNNKCLPLIEEESTDLGKCTVAYRFFVSILEYLGFKYVGRGSKYNDLIDEELANAVNDMLNGGDRTAYKKAVSDFLFKNKKD